MALKSLEDHNAEQIAAYDELERQRTQSVPTGIQCPNCEGELVNPTPNELVGEVSPFDINVTCQAPNCDYTGTAKAFV